MSDVTQTLEAIKQGEAGASAQLLPLVYDELRRLAARRLAREAPGQKLQATALVHEAYLRLVGDGQPREWNSRGHFFAAALGLPRRTADRRWAFARAWLYDRLRSEERCAVVRRIISGILAQTGRRRSTEG
jgi:hypothetical protein